MSPARPPHPASVEARLGEFRLYVGIRRETGLITVTGGTPQVRLHEPRSADPTPPACPQCGRALTQPDR